MGQRLLDLNGLFCNGDLVTQVLSLHPSLSLPLFLSSLLLWCDFQVNNSVTRVHTVRPQMAKAFILQNGNYPLNSYSAQPLEHSLSMVLLCALCACN